ncbi:MAG: glycosyltransferase family 39 protein [Candidatus Hydrogenedentes bacterium]|nr:glycosyltransferase family 39 protein [Candidatus Hydrogenedentota bacterium]
MDEAKRPLRNEPGAPARAPLTARLAGLFAGCFVAYLAAMWLAARAGIEAIGGHVTPFYATYRPCYGTLAIPLAVLALGAVVWWALTRVRAERPVSCLYPPAAAAIAAGCAVGATGLSLWLGNRAAHLEFGRALSLGWLFLRRHAAAVVLVAALLSAAAVVFRGNGRAEARPSGRATAAFLAGLVVFAFLFPGVIATLRDGNAGIADAYSRAPVEYIGDIGRGGSIRGLFREYCAIHDTLSMHSKVHPPGPVALLWMLSWLVGAGPLALSIATMAVGALAVIPLFLWARELAGTRVALLCCALYALMPSVVLFTATSADILFTPFALLALFLFDRAIRRRSIPCAAAAGAVYAVLSLLSFNLLALGAYFAVAGVWFLRTPATRVNVAVTAAAMATAFLAFHGIVYLWSGFDAIECFRLAKAQFDADQARLVASEGRWPVWAWKGVNPACWFYFAGIPVSVLWVWRMLRPEPPAAPGPTGPGPTGSRPADTRALFIVFALTLAAFDLLYLGRGEGERSALYLFPFLALPAAHLLAQHARADGSPRPVLATLGFLAFQCWFTEMHFYTYW